MFKKLTIVGKVERTKPEQGYYVDVAFEYGDNELTHTEHFGPFYDNEKEYLLKFINMLEACRLVDTPQSYLTRSDDVSYADIVSAVAEWNGAKPVTETGYSECIKRIDFGIPKEVNSDDFEASLTAWTVHYYDAEQDCFYDVEAT